MVQILFPSEQLCKCQRVGDLTEPALALTLSRAKGNTWLMLMRQQNPAWIPSTRAALDALDWVRKEIVRLKAPDQFRLGIRETSVQRLCTKLLQSAAHNGRSKHFRMKPR